MKPVVELEMKVVMKLEMKPGVIFFLLSAMESKRGEQRRNQRGKKEEIAETRRGKKIAERRRRNRREGEEIAEERGRNRRGEI
ncbi:unnamed protein product [Cochlearia groenlandica]